MALISDLHANAIALEAVLADVAEQGADLVVCLGDTATLGPRPAEVLARLRDLGCPCIMGNHDEFLLDPALIHTYSEAPVIVAAVDQCREERSEEELAFVRTFSRTLALDLDGVALLLFHGSPRSNMEDLLATTPPGELDARLDGHAAPVMAGGHTHVQMLRQHRGALLVNPGSLGQPFQEHAGGGPPVVLPHAEYAIVDGRRGRVGVTLRKLDLDRGALRREAEAWRSPLAPMLASMYR